MTFKGADRTAGRALHAQLVQACRGLASMEYEVARLLAEMEQARGFEALGYATLVDYGEQALGLGRRRCTELARVGKRLTVLPALAEGFANGELGWTKVREVARVAVPETDAAWAERAAAVSCRALERQVRVTHVGQSPPEEGAALEAEPARVRLAFDMEASDAALVQRALKVLRQQALASERQVEDGVLLADLARVALDQAPRGEGDPMPPERHRVVMTVCDDCGSKRVGEHEVYPDVAAEIGCDAEVVEMRPGRAHGRLQRRIPPKRRRAVMHRDKMRCAVPGCSCDLWLDVHHIVPRSQGGGHGIENLVLLCSAHHRMLHDGMLSAERKGDRVAFFDERGEPIGPGRRGVWAGPKGSAERPRVGASAGRCVDGGGPAGGSAQVPFGSAVVDRALALLRRRALKRDVIRRELGLSEGHVRRLMRYLELEGDAVQLASFEWVATAAVARSA